jgi:hypothetical protein
MCLHLAVLFMRTMNLILNVLLQVKHLCTC